MTKIIRNQLFRKSSDKIDDMTLGHDEGGNTGGGDGRAHGVPLLGHVDLPVPPPPGLGGSEHATSTAHVTKSSLAGPDDRSLYKNSDELMTRIACGL